MFSIKRKVIAGHETVVLGVGRFSQCVAFAQGPNRHNHNTLQNPITTEQDEKQVHTYSRTRVAPRRERRGNIG
jgi:hypothetical protein